MARPASEYTVFHPRPWIMKPAAPADFTPRNKVMQLFPDVARVSWTPPAPEANPALILHAALRPSATVPNRCLASSTRRAECSPALRA